eukprot:CAMPEP_0176344348 /NCGR_PEP_ID=MMETSP0126-20121128/4639_1 /TAXON_ID=141414 ORGANISM="Strombidinopsis acuminatum, Strain SPMC142" /NCGR_SAMPLE_ID=MMETSP0126 /ASSEMBLY_ACC=CAM_ASM_000229 /LENGTH=42 /DNA_ID= /DNA_START= /DNA_END= /DNA_ORIENTATION=
MEKKKLEDLLSKFESIKMIKIVEKETQNAPPADDASKSNENA